MFTNKTLNWSCLFSVALLALVLFTPVRIVFELSVLSWKLYLFGLGLAFVPLIVMEIAKVIEHTYQNKKENKQ